MAVTDSVLTSESYILQYPGSGIQVLADLCSPRRDSKNSVHHSTGFIWVMPFGLTNAPTIFFVPDAACP